ncbi:Terpenoid cyclases/protein prenyltransferase alpha-alpha toroid [Russula decolorans]
MWTPLDIPASPKQPFTDYSRWRLRDTYDGRHVWDFLKSDQELEAHPPSDADKYWLGLPLNLPSLPTPTSPLDAARNGYSYHRRLQRNDGHWAAEFGGPMFLLPGLVIGSYVAHMSFRDEERLEMIRYLFNRAHPDDGGWGLHIEGSSTAMGTALNYAALRLLGVPADHPVIVRSRATLHKLGGAAASASWAKFWLSVLNVYDWEGNNPIPPELWLLPQWLPFHPSRWWVHTRTIYVPMSYLYGVKFKAALDPLILALREELYTQPYDTIDWPAQRNNVSEADLRSPHSKLFDYISVILGAYEQCCLPPLRNAGVKYAYKLVVCEDENTSYQTLGPVSKMLNVVARFHGDGSGSYAYRRHEDKRRDFMWLGAEGMMMTGTNGSQLWDIGFIAQSLAETGLGNDEDNQPSVIKALQWLDRCQIQENARHFGVMNRHRSKGAWPFSTREQGYNISDCTGEGLKAVLLLQTRLEFTPKLVNDDRLFDAVDTLLTMQNPDGGFASYELVRGPSWVELLNPSEVFGKIMIEYEYPECTTSVLAPLFIFRKHYPHYRAEEIDKTTARGVKFLHTIQQPEGGWPGYWGICFTYATMFALQSLCLAGETYETSDSVRRACDYLVSKQRADGGWGESYKSCEACVWVEHENTQVVQTSWAAMALMYGKYPYAGPIAKAVKLVMSRQLPDGSWAQEAIEGIFSRTCAISYPNFKFTFTVWMLAKAHKYLEERGALPL